MLLRDFRILEKIDALVRKQNEFWWNMERSLVRPNVTLQFQTPREWKESMKKFKKLISPPPSST